MSPASEMPVAAVQRGANFVNINLQKTPMDYLCTMNIHGLMDDVFPKLMDKLGYEIPEFKLERRLQIKLSEDKKNVLLTGLDQNGACYQIFKQIQVSGLMNNVTNTLPSARNNV